MICRSEDLTERGAGVRFEVTVGDRRLPAFVVRSGGRVHAYLNNCPHQGTELDWTPGDFFDESGRHLVCATHGALYEPKSGTCVAGPCRGMGLTQIEVMESDGWVALSI